MFSDDDLLPLSALQHLGFCERQWGLIHLEQQWVENRLTAEGRLLHEAADTETVEWRGEARVHRGLRLRSLRYGLSGRADVVEFHPSGPRPVEYKRGRPKADQVDEVQLCAQVLCLEEMLEVRIESGDLFYGEPRRRMEIGFDEQLRARTIALIEHLHALTKARDTPPAVHERKCRSCSLIEICQPRATGGRSALSYLKRALAQAREDRVK
jgi:CRISPR-associated exonuclease Cas4